MGTNMDPISQGAWGATFAQSAARKSQVKAATLMGCFGGLAPDLDVLIFSPADPLLFLEYHRQFTHALIFIPVGALLVTAVMHRIIARGLSFRQAYLSCLIGYATHGLLDACTTYGTLLFWPFSDARIAWNNISIIDPLFTLPILALIILGVRSKSPNYARLAAVWGLAYLLIGISQRDRAEEAAYLLAESRGHEPIRLEAKPGFANLLLWKTVYETGGRYYIDAIRVGFANKSYPGTSAEKLDVRRHFPWLNPNTQQAADIERFRWFSNDYLAVDPRARNRVIDVRYSVVPNEIDALWAVDLDPEKPGDAHITWRSLRRQTAAQTSRWWHMLTAP